MDGSLRASEISMALPVETVLAFLTALAFLCFWSLAANQCAAPIGGLIKLSILYFLVPLLLVTAMAHSISGYLLIFMPFMVLLEEWLKRLAGYQVFAKKRSIFFLVALFGIWELAASKSLIPFLPGWKAIASGWGLVAFIWLASLPTVMHTATAAIYAFYPTRHGTLRYWICVGVHWAFNESRELYADVPFSDLSPLLLIIDSAIWVILLSCLILKRWPSSDLHRTAEM
jgi:hypothetical protein